MSLADNVMYNEILDELKEEFKLSKVELERVCNSQFRVLRDVMLGREGKVLQMVHLGKFRPTAYNIDYLKNQLDKINKNGKDKGNT